MVIDSSALIAYLRREDGSKVVDAALTKGDILISTVNHTEIKGKLVGAGLATPQVVDAEFHHLEQLLEIVPYDLEQSQFAAYYYARRNPYDLSLGDCACLALAEARGVNVLTAEMSWAKIPSLPFKVQLIRKHKT
jgi:PIN domain nuclease of toxin-antitoxin system